VTAPNDKSAVPPGFSDFEEEDRVRDGPMREEIVTMVVEALNAQGYPDLTAESIRTDPDHRAAALDMLADCRPLPVVRALMDELSAA
jgi:hypothetical protein